MHYLKLVEDQIYTWLTGDPALSLLTDLRVFLIEAPPGTMMPYIEIKYFSGGTTNTSPRDDFDVTLRVVGCSTDDEQAATIAGLIRDIIHRQPINVLDWSNYWLAEGRLIEYVKYESIATIQFTRGAFYEIRADSTE